MSRPRRIEPAGFLRFDSDVFYSAPKSAISNVRLSAHRAGPTFPCSASNTFPSPPKRAASNVRPSALPSRLAFPRFVSNTFCSPPKRAASSVRRSALPSRVVFPCFVSNAFRSPPKRATSDVRPLALPYRVWLPLPSPPASRPRRASRHLVSSASSRWPFRFSLPNSNSEELASKEASSQQPGHACVLFDLPAPKDQSISKSADVTTSPNLAGDRVDAAPKDLALSLLLRDHGLLSRSTSSSGNPDNPPLEHPKTPERHQLSIRPEGLQGDRRTSEPLNYQSR